MFTSTQCNHLVVDTGAIIQGVRLERMGKELLTIPEVLEEARDAKARAFLATLPVPLKTRSPTPDDVKAVADFSRKTGDYPNLSITDIKVLALTYMLERETNGIEHLRKEPKARTFGPNARVRWAVHKKSKKQRRKKKANQEAQEGEWSDEEGQTAEHEHHQEGEESCGEGEHTAEQKETQSVTVEEKKVEEEKQDATESVANKEDQEKTEAVVAKTEKKEETAEEKKEGEKEQEGKATENLPEGEQPQQKRKRKNRGRKRARKKPISAEGSDAAVQPQGVEGGAQEPQQPQEPQPQEPQKPQQPKQPNLIPKEADWGSWITPENVKNFSSFDATVSEEELKVACTTTDYSMQNVLLQMGLKLISVDGLVIKRVTQYLFRCSSCFKITMEMDREFCPSCGNHTLQKVAYSVDNEGNIVLHASRFKQPKLRGTKYSIPQFQGGRKANNIILREDEIPLKQRKKKEKDLFDPDYDFLTPRKNPDQKTYVFGYGRKNPNESRKRTGKRKKNSGSLN